MFYGNDYHGVPGVLEEYKTGTGEVFNASFDEAISDNPYTKMLNYLELKSQPGEALDFVSDYTPKRYSKDEAAAKAKEQGVVVNNLPDDGINEPALNLLIERQYKKKARRETVDASAGGFVAGTAEFLGGAAGSMVDPLNIATSFIPVVGQARYATWLAKAQGPLGRAGIRAGVGAAEGFVGSALMEPANYALSQELGDDYTMANSLANVGFGTVIGGGLHVLTGALGDAFDSYSGKKNAASPDIPNGSKVATQMDAASPETRVAYAKAAVVQAAQDQTIKVDAIREAHILDVQTKITKLDEKLTAALAVKDHAAISLLSEQKANLHAQLDITPEDLGVRAIKRAEDQGIKFEASDDGRDLGIVAKNESGEVVGRTILRRDEAGGLKTHPYEQTQVNADFQRKGIASAMYAYAERETGLTMRPGDSQTPNARALWENPDRPFGERQVATQQAKAPGEVERGLREVGEEAPDSSFVNDGLVREQSARAEENPLPTQSLEEIKAAVDEDMALLKQDLEQMELDPESIAELKVADDNIKVAEEKGKMLKAMALCALRK